MNLLYRIVYAAHANGTHHKLALDALRYLSVPDADGWVRVFLKDAERYMTGAKAPDNEFKDFQNHVLHVRDEFWGGALDTSEEWYAKLVAALKAEQWSEAVYTAGVLSHYVCDPVHPFHTAQSEAENNIHRACEWSISKSYDALRKIGEDAQAIELKVSDEPTWLRALVCRGAEISNTNYERLIAHYDISRGVSDPPAGLDPIARAVSADLIIYAARSFAVVLDRAIRDAGVSPPAVELTAETVLAALKVPAKWVTKKLADAEDRRQVEAMYDELLTTGRVEANLPEDDRTVRDLHRAEVLAPRVEDFEKQRSAAIAKSKKPAAGVARAVPPPLPAAKPTAAAPQHAVPKSAGSPAPAPVTAPAPAPLPAAAPIAANPGLMEKLAKVAVPPLEAPKPGTPNQFFQFFLTSADDLEKAPSIGPKTAERFTALGIRTVAQFLEADPATLAKGIDARHIPAATIADWQDQARLVLGIPNLRGTHAQLLVGANYRSVIAVAEASPDQLSADILAYAGTRDGQRVLREGSPPDVARIKSWCENAKRALAA